MKNLTLTITSLTLVLFLILISNLTYAQIETKLIASDSEAGDWFGWNSSISGDYVVIGAHRDNDNGNESGSAYIFKHDGTSWIQEAKLTASDGVAEDWFGLSVSINGDYVVVGAYGDDDNGSESGSAYIFKREGTSWNEQAKLIASDGAAGEIFGRSVSIWGDYVVVGAFKDNSKGNESGSIYVFKRNGNYWFQEAKLTASDGTTGDWYGYPVAIRGSYIVTGAHGDDNKSGSVYVFKYNGTNWIQDAKLRANDGAAEDYFGASVSLGWSYIVIGSYADDGYGGDSGSVYVFKFNGSNWIQETKLTASDGARDDYFGRFVSNWGNYIVVSAHGDDDNGNESGSAYIFKRDGSLWNEEAKLNACDSASEDAFGVPVNISENYIVCGAPKDDDRGNESGSAYIYQLEPRPQLYSINDVPNDQGGNVTLKWNASFLDIGKNLSFYSIWRALPEGELSELTKVSAKDITKDFSGNVYRSESSNGKDYAWEWLANQPAYRFESYSYTASTLYDSMSTTDGKHYFLILAHTINPEIFYNSNIDSGYSVDNLAPAPPANLTASVVENAIELNWEKSAEPDFSVYIIYRNGSIYATTSQNNYIDANVEIGQSYSYKLTAVDVHENNSDFSEEALVTITNVHRITSDIPKTFKLSQNYPNPFNPETSISYQIPNTNQVEIRIYNTIGIEIKSLVNEKQNAGHYNVQWDGKNSNGNKVVSGIYLYQIKAGDYVCTKKMALMK